MEDAIGTHLALCERCGGAGRISAYRHISGGTCFECEGTGYSEARTVKAGGLGARISHGTVNYREPRYKNVSIEEIGAVTLRTTDGKRFHLAQLSCPHGSGCWFEVRGSQVCNVELQQGMIADGYTPAKVRQALQRALKR